ncbi:MAG: hypothetical protein OXG44_12650 [Gammaproteobacteria bacterium]|nr:hypothetical protein [Gammaproteobacteria bacterium]
MWAIYQIDEGTASTGGFDNPYLTERDAQRAIGNHWQFQIRRQVDELLEYHQQITDRDEPAGLWDALRETYMDQIPPGFTAQRWDNEQENLLGLLASSCCDDLGEIVFYLGNAPNLVEFITDICIAKDTSTIVWPDRNNLPPLVAAEEGYRVSLHDYETYYLMPVPDSEKS